MDLCHLSNNELTELASNIFSDLNLDKLRYLYLNSNSLSELRSGMFLGLTSLTTLRLDKNNLITVRASDFRYLPRPLTVYFNFVPSGLEYPPNDDNPWQCDSWLCWLKQELEAGTITGGSLFVRWMGFGTYQPEKLFSVIILFMVRFFNA